MDWVVKSLSLRVVLSLVNGMLSTTSTLASSLSSVRSCGVASTSTSLLPLTALRMDWML